MRGLTQDDNKDDPFTKAYAEEMKKPKAERNWKRLEDILATIGKERDWDELNTNVKMAQVKIMAEDYEAARKLLVAAQEIAPKNVIVRRMLIQVVQLDPKLGPDRALELYDRTVKEFGDSPTMRIIKADIIIAKHGGQANKEEMKVELAELFAGIDDWTPQQKGELWSNMAGKYLALSMNAEARQYLTLAADALPHQLPIPILMFQLALEANDDAAMKDAQERIVKIVGSNSDSAWLYTEARRRLALIRRGQLDQAALPEIRILVNRALEQRPEWHELHILNGELEAQAGNLAKAIEHLDRAQELGRPAAMYTAQHIKLLWLAKRVQQAGELLERIPEAQRFALLGQLYPQILFSTNRVEEALAQTKAVVDANPENAQACYLYSQLLAQSSLAPKLTDDQRKAALADAIKQMRRAVELQPEFPEAWLMLISYYAQINDIEQAQSVLREAQLALSGDNLQVFLAKGYETLRRGFDAETMYRAVYEAKPDDIARTQQLAAFYLGNVYQLPDRNIKATPLINKILRAGADKKLQPSDPTLLWARRHGAKMLAETGDYQNLLKAEKLLASNSQDGELTVEDKLAMAEILANRPEPLSRKKAIELLEEVAEIQPLGERAEIVLGELYYATNQDDWSKYSRQMQKAIARFPDSLLPRAAYVKNLLKRNDKQSLDEATKHVTRMRQINPKYVGTFEYTVRLADKLGKQEAARAELLRAVPDMSQTKALAPTDVQMLTLLANLLVELDDLDSAEKIYRNMAAIDPNQILAYANFLGMHRGVDQCFAKLNEVYAPERIPALLQVALTVVRKQRENVGDKFDGQMQTWLDTGLRENPDSIPLLMDQADFYDLKKRYKESAEVYRKLLDRKDLVGIRRAVVLNNFAFLLALDSSATQDADALKLVNQAVDIMGPNSDILDTRAVVYMSRKDYQRAIEDLELAVTDSPTASKYFHLAQAHLLAGQNRAAVEAWEKAESLGLNHDAINLMEIPLFDQLKAKIDQIRGASVTQADGRRRAG
jgi:tetratricopeptide (TPR) repeat protein